MAIPLSMPNSDDIEDSHRLDLLLEQLLITLRQVLIQRRRVAAAADSHPVSRTQHHRHRNESDGRLTPEEAPRNDSEDSTTTRVTPEEERTTTTTRTTPSSLQLPLPDLVIDSPSMKEREGRMCGLEREDDAGNRSATSWVENGSELIRLAGQLLDQEEVDPKIGEKVRGKEEDPKKKGEEERMNVLSLMCPLLGNSVWTTVALLVVWGLLAHAR